MITKKGIMEKRRLFDLFLIILILLILLGFFGVFKKTCDNDKCFEDGIKNCRNIVYFQNKDGNLLKYSVDNWVGYCVIDVKMEKTINDKEVRDLFEGKEMRCKIPKKELVNVNKNMDSYIVHCNGVLKEKMYEYVLKKMYGVVIGNIDEIIDEIKKEA